MKSPNPTEASISLTETILVIDDSQVNLNFLSVTLSSTNYNIFLELNSKKGIELAKNQQVDLILLDVIMPKVDGFETCRILKSDPATKDIPIIFMTALSDAEQKVKGLSLGAVDYITKPFQQEEVLARIQVHLKIRRLNLELDQQKQQLEQRVQERTAELSQALEALKKTQLQLVHSEKISTLGQLVAGIAHEVNNPLNFISSNIQHANQYVQDLIDLVKLYQEKFPLQNSEIEDKIAAIDLEHVQEDLPKLISSMKLGTDRIKGIIHSLRNFSRADGEKKKAVDIHDGLETTLMILQHRLKVDRKRPTIKVIKEYGNLPKVECYPGQLNQVFMNLLANAIDAIEESGVVVETLHATSVQSSAVRGEIPIQNPHSQAGAWERAKIQNPQICICTTVDKDGVIIRIADNGLGMSESVQTQIFNPFFTTKPEGKGTGLGLSISHQIITEKHGGTLQCISSVGEGTEFVIQIPLKTYTA